MKVDFIQTCLTDTELLRYYADKSSLKKAGKEIKNCIIENSEFSKFDLFKDYAVTVEQMKYKGKKYAIVTHSQINYFFEII